MDLEAYLAQVIAEESEKLILRHHAYHNALHHEYIRNKKRVSNLKWTPLSRQYSAEIKRVTDRCAAEWRCPGF